MIHHANRESEKKADETTNEGGLDRSKPIRFFQVTHLYAHSLLPREE